MIRKYRLPTLKTYVNRDSVQSAFQSHLFYLFEITHRNTDLYKKWYRINVIDRDSAVGIATRYELDDPGIESR